MFKIIAIAATLLSGCVAYPVDGNYNTEVVPYVSPNVSVGINPLPVIVSTDRYMVGYNYSDRYMYNPPRHYYRERPYGHWNHPRPPVYRHSRPFQPEHRSHPNQHNYQGFGNTRTSPPQHYR